MHLNAAADHPYRILQGSAAFHGIEPADLDGCSAEVQTIPAGTTLFQQGDTADVADVVETGILGLYEQDENAETSRPFRKVVPGDLMGEYGLLCDQPRSAGSAAQGSNATV